MLAQKEQELQRLHNQMEILGANKEIKTMSSQPQFEGEHMTIQRQLEEKLARLEKENQELHKQNQDLSAKKSPQKFIDFDETELEGTPGKTKFMIGKNLEESSYLPMNIDPVQMEKKKVIKKVRFHDDEPIVVPPSQEMPEVKVGTKRVLTRTSDLKSTIYSEESETLNSQKHDEKQMLELGEQEVLAMEES